MKQQHAQRAFTLVELSIVLVIIGLIIGGVLTGQQIIQNARVTNTINAVQSYEGQFQTYAQNYGALPGDDASASSRFPYATNLMTLKNGGKGGGDGTLGAASSFDASSSSEIPAYESRLVWAHLRAAGLVKNQQDGTDISGQPPNPFGGIYGFQNGAFGGTLSGPTLCLNSVPVAAAQAIDGRLDDGLPNAGTIQATTSSGAGSAAGAVADSYGDGQTYTLCVRM